MSLSSSKTPAAASALHTAKSQGAVRASYNWRHDTGFYVSPIAVALENLTINAYTLTTSL